MTDPVTACERLRKLLERAQHIEAGRDESSDQVREPLLRFAHSLLAMKLRPALESDWLDKDPVHISLFGGTNSGKSTLLNVLLGRSVAGMNVTARFSQHPEAYCEPSLGDAWLDEFPTRFESYERHRDRHPPRQTDVELGSSGYRPALAVLDPERISDTALASPVAGSAVLWDAPDFSTEHAAFWIGSVLDAVALADVVVMTVTDESYADERGAVLMRMISSAGVHLFVVANKLPDTGELLADIQAKLDENWRGRGSGLPRQNLYALPLVDGSSADERLTALLASDAAAKLRDGLAAEARRGKQLKRKVVVDSARFLDKRRAEILEPLRKEIEAANAYAALVDNVTRDEFLVRYRRDYLDGEKYEEFNAALVRLMELLDVPGIGPIVKLLSEMARVPLRLAKGLLSNLFSGGKSAPVVPAEKEAIGSLFEAWLSALKAHAQLLATRNPHPAWHQVAKSIDSPAFQDELARGFASGYERYRGTIEQELRDSARQIYAELEKRPKMLNMLRGANLAGNLAVTGGAVLSGGLSPSDFVIGPAVSGLWRILISEGLDVYVRSQEQSLKSRQLGLMQELVQDTLVGPATALFATEVGSDEIDAASADLDVLIKSIVSRYGGSR